MLRPSSFLSLPDLFYQRVAPTPVAAPKLLLFNEELASELNLSQDFFPENAGAQLLSGNQLVAGTTPIALAYAGHQFGHFVAQLGDGRAILLGEAIDRNGTQRDIQLKGSGPTAFSRNGDGRSALGPALREYIISEALHALGVPTTRSLAVVATGETVRREQAQPGGIVTRVAKSHIRVGTFEYFAARGDIGSLKTLTHYAIQRYFPICNQADNPVLAFYGEVIAGQARLMAHWLKYGFIHGVMNTDNCNISGETIDFGPCAFLDDYNPAKVFSSIDRHGRYAFGNQPTIAKWNLGSLGGCLLPLIGQSPNGSLDENHEKARELAEAALERFDEVFVSHWRSEMTTKIGISDPIGEDVNFVTDLLEIMKGTQADYTQTFLALTALCADKTLREDKSDQGLQSLGLAAELVSQEAFKTWLKRWRERIKSTKDRSAEIMLRANPRYIPRNHLVENALRGAVENGDIREAQQLVNILKKPFEDQCVDLKYTRSPDATEVVTQTFCGT